LTHSATNKTHMRYSLSVITVGFALVSNLFALQSEPTTEPKKAVAKYQYKSEGIEVPAATADEPKIVAFGPESIMAAKKYLDDGANYWVRERSCVACHSTGVYMVERPVLTALLGKPSTEVLDDFVESVTDKIGPPEIRDGVKYWGASIQSVWRSSGLAAWDKYVTGTLSEHTDTSLRHTLQCLADEGFIKTIDQVEIPYITTDFELTVQAARAIASAPGWLATVKDTDTLERIDRMKKYLSNHVPISDYEHAVQLQLSECMPDLVTHEQRDASIAMLWRQQQPDGGWSTRRMSDLMSWHRKMDPKVVSMIQSEPDAANPESDPYMTAFAIVLLCEAGVPATDSRIQKGIAWLKQNQRASGRWWMKSLFRDTYHYSTYISTAQALRALALCGEIPVSGTPY
jgi:squalene-hopene/tetraprenyl-beta-curcumene cyclase